MLSDLDTYSPHAILGTVALRVREEPLASLGLHSLQSPLAKGRSDVA